MSSIILRLIASCNDANLNDSGSTGDTGVDTAVPLPEMADVSMPSNGSSTIVFANAAGVPQAFYLGSFYEMTDPYVSAIAFDTPSTPDTCGLTLYTQAESSAGTGGTQVAQSAGIVTLNGPTGLFLPNQISVGVYQLNMDPAIFPFHSTWDMSGDGDLYPAFAGSIEVPGAFDVITPVSGFALNGRLQVTWTTPTVDPTPLTIRLETVNSATGDSGLIYCTVTNDGAFTIPAGMVNQLPARDYTSLHMQKRISRTIETSDTNRSLQLNGAVTAIIFGQ